MVSTYFTARPSPTRKSERGTRNSRERSLAERSVPVCSAFPLPRSALISSRRLQHCHRLHMRRLREQIERPYRGGLHWNVTLRLTSQPVARVVYISCDPATLARDRHRLIVNYGLAAGRAVDLVPQP